MQKRLFFIPAAVVVFILYFTVCGDRGLLMISRLQRDRDEMQQRLSELKGENDKLKREIAALQTDRRYLESIARRDFGLVRSNETIYQFPIPAGEQKPAVKPAPSAQQQAPQGQLQTKGHQQGQNAQGQRVAPVQKQAQAHKVEVGKKDAAPGD